MAIRPRYIEDVFDWQHPKTTWSWRGAQYFGDDGSAGQHYRVELLAVDLGAARRANQAKNLNTLAGIGVVLDSVDVVRTEGTVADACEGPS